MRHRRFEAQVDCAVLYANHTLGVSKIRCYARGKRQDAYCDGLMCSRIAFQRR